MKKPITEETRLKMRLAKLGKPRPDMRGNSFAKGAMTQEHKEKIRNALKGKVPKNIKMIAGWNKGKSNYWALGSKNHNWKGDKVGEGALHDWVKSRLGFPNTCEQCGFVSEDHHKIHWANKSGEYKRDLKDWMRLCVRCHKLYDNKHRKKRIWKNQFGSGTY